MLKGSDKLTKQLNAISSLKLSSKAAATIIYNRSQELVPVDTGELKESGEVIDVGNNQFTVQYGTDHAIFQEFGTSTQHGTPFLRPAIDDTRDEVLKATADEIEKEIKEAI